MRMPFIINKMSRSRYLWIFSLVIATVSVLASVGHLSVSAQKSDPVVNKIYVRGSEPGTVDQNSFIETFKVDGLNGTDNRSPRDSAPSAIGTDASSSLRISQVYTRGGEAGATYQNDFVEIFNAGSTAVDINGWAMVVISFEGATQQSIGARFNSSFSVPPGMHLLFRFNGNGGAGQAVPGEYPIITDISLGSTSGQIMLLSPSQNLPTGCPTSFSQTGQVTDFVGYGTSACFEGAVAPVPAANQSLTRIGGGCSDTDNNANDFALQAPNPRISTSALTPCGSTTPTPTPTPTPTTPVLNFSASQYTVAENAGSATITVTRSGVVNLPVTVNFATANGTATAGSDYTATSGTLSFAANELQKTFNVAITDDAAVESNETVSLTLSGATGTAVLGSPSTATLTITDNDSTTPPPSTSNSNLRISQIYTRGGEAGATYQNDFVEVFNAGSTAVDINGWAMVVITFEGTTQQAIGSRFNSSFSVPPGMHLLFRFNGNGTVGQAVPGEFPIITDISLGSTSGQVMLLSPSQNLPTGCPTSFGLNGAVADFVGYGTSTCFEGAPAPVPAANQSLTRIGGGCTDTDNNANDFALQAPNPRISTSALTPCGSTAPTTPVLNFSAAQYTVAENAGNATITVIRSGVVNVPVTVNFATANGTATAGSDYTAASGTLSFAANELQKTFNVAITDDAAVESNETVSLTLSGATGTAVLGSPSSATLTIQDNDGTTPPSTSNSNLRISQIYTRGGEAGATYQNDFVEVFNAGSTAVDINGWAMVVITFEGTTQQAIGSRFNSSFSVPPGMHLLFRFNGNGTVGQPAPGEFPIITDISLGSTSGQIMLLSPSQNLPTGCPTSFGLNGAVADFVGYGTSACFEGAPAPVPPANQSLTRIGGGCTDTDNNASDFALQAPNPRISTSALTPCGSTAPSPTPTPTTPVLNFSASQYTVAENAGNATITVVRSGVVNVPVTVNFATANGTATAGSDYTAASGTLSFAANELQKTFNVAITDDAAVESNETVSLTLSGATGTAVLGSPSSATLTIQDNDGTTPPPSSNANLRISQVYTRGGEAGATYQNDFVEVFNAGTTAVNINGWAMVVITFEGTTQQAIGSRFNSNFSMPPGMHLLFRFKGNGTVGQPVPGEYPIINDISLGSTSGQVMLLSPTQALPAGCPTSFGANGAVTDFVGYGTSACFEGTVAPVPPANKSLTRQGAGCNDVDDNANDFPLENPNPRISSSPLTPCGASNPQATVVNFSIADPGSFPIIDATNFSIINKTSAFVDQHYHDFLSRYPDGSGLQFWVNNIESCGSDAQCREVKRIDTSASFFLSQEFQQTGYLVERFYKVGYGDGTGTSTFGGQHQLPVPMVRLNEFVNDTQRIGRGVVVLTTGWEQQLANNKQAYAQEFVQTTRFTAAFATTMTPTQFVDKLNSNAGNVLSVAERTTAINLFGGVGDSSNVTARAQVVRQVAEDTDLYNAEYNRGFVMAEYFGYLRRNPNEGPDNDFTGYDFWLTKMNQFGGDYNRAEMVKAFISSIEYTNRVGQ